MKTRRIVDASLGWCAGCGLARLLFPSSITSEIAIVGAVTLILAAFVGGAALHWPALRAAWRGGDEWDAHLTTKREASIGLAYRILDYREPTEEERAKGIERVITRAELTGASFVHPPEVP